MRKLCVLLFSVVSLTLTAQNMKVLEFRLLENDLTANIQGTSKVDQNGETAALIKIQTPERGFSFDGGMQGIVASEEHTGEMAGDCPLPSALEREQEGQGSAIYPPVRLNSFNSHTYYIFILYFFVPLCQN